MAKPVISYAQLEDLMRSFGFSLTILPTGHRQFRHPQSIAQLTLPAYAHGNKEARPFHWMSVRGTLDDFGFLDRDKFFDAIRERSPAA